VPDQQPSLEEPLAESCFARLLPLIMACGAMRLDQPPPAWWLDQFRLLQRTGTSAGQACACTLSAAAPKARTLEEFLQACANLTATPLADNSPTSNSPTSDTRASVPPASAEDIALLRQACADAAQLVLRLSWLQQRFREGLEQAARDVAYDMAYGLSHELNNPLANIAARARLLLDGEADPLRRQTLAAITDQALRGGEMLGDLMLYARPPQLTLVERPLWPWLAEWVSDIVAEAEPWAASRSVELQWTAPDSLAASQPTQASQPTVSTQANTLHGPEVTGEFPHSAEAGVRIDATALGEALWAVIRNGIEWARTCVHLSLELTDTEVALAVADDGPGFASHIAGLAHAGGTPQPGAVAHAAVPTHPLCARALHPYFSGREAGRGLGLGLPKADRLLRLHGGRLELPGGCGYGRVRLVLPRQQLPGR
jgi:signal transduction histidine kinase